MGNVATDWSEQQTRTVSPIDLSSSATPTRGSATQVRTTSVARIQGQMDGMLSSMTRQKRYDYGCWQRTKRNERVDVVKLKQLAGDTRERISSRPPPTTTAPLTLGASPRRTSTTRDLRTARTSTLMRRTSARRATALSLPNHLSSSSISSRNETTHGSGFGTSTLGLAGSADSVCAGAGVGVRAGRLGVTGGLDGAVAGDAADDGLLFQRKG